MQSRTKFAIALAILLFISAASTGANKYGVADKRVVQFYAPVQIENTVVPAGTYEVQHTMDGSDHVMVFSRIDSKHQQTPVRAKCTLLPLNKPVEQTETVFKQNERGELVLVRMQFKGDRAKHVF
jgi:hypothetical protein